MPAGLILLSTDAVGGVWHYSLALAQGLAAAGQRALLAVVGPAPDARQTAAAREVPGCTLVTTGTGLDWTARNHEDLARIAATLARLAADHGAASLHLHAPCLAAFPYPAPVVCVAHSCIATWWAAVRATPLPEPFAFHAAATRDGLLRADAAIAPTAAFARQLSAVHGIATPRHIHNGAPPPAAVDAPRQPIVLTAGRLWDEGKNTAMLDRAAAMMRTPVHAAGPIHGQDGTHLPLTAARPLGNLPPPALHAAMREAAIFASPSLYEPFGLAVLEAAQSGMALVLADIPSFRELWDSAAIFLPPADPNAWAHQLDTLAADPAACATLGRAAHRRAQRYTQAAMLTATAGVHASLARQPAHAV